jgi:hypothetical protein
VSVKSLLTNSFSKGTFRSVMEVAFLTTLFLPINFNVIQREVKRFWICTPFTGKFLLCHPPIQLSIRKKVH